MKTYHNEAQTAERTGYSRRQLSQWRQDGTGFPHLKIGRKVLYDVEAVDLWLAEHAVSSTSQSTVRDAEAAR